MSFTAGGFFLLQKLHIKYKHCSIPRMHSAVTKLICKCKKKQIQQPTILVVMSILFHVHFPSFLMKCEPLYQYRIKLIYPAWFFHGGSTHCMCGGNLNWHSTFAASFSSSFFFFSYTFAFIIHQM